MKVIFRPLGKEFCTLCDHKAKNMNLVEEREYKITKINKNPDSYELMGWGNLKFDPQCFQIIEE